MKITQNDVRAIQLAKAALYAGIALLMDRLGIDHVDRIRLAGAFGSHIDVKYATMLGMLPDCDLNHVRSAGNAAGTGARIALLDSTSRGVIEDLVRRIEKVETAIEPRFQQHFVEAMAIPHKTAPYTTCARWSSCRSRRNRPARARPAAGGRDGRIPPNPDGRVAGGTGARSGCHHGAAPAPELCPGASLSVGTLRRSRTQYILIGAAVLGLHAVICWLLLYKYKARVLAVPEVAQNLELLWIPVPPGPSPAPEETQKQKPRASRHSSPSAPAEPAPAPAQGVAPPENNAITPPIDWQAALAREAEAWASAKSEHRFKEFDFPRRAPRAVKAPEFAWDRTHTHRVESDSGALIVHINDNCAFVMTPLPFVFCKLGKRPANAALFEHMKDSLAGATGSAQ